MSNIRSINIKRNISTLYKHIKVTHLHHLIISLEDCLTKQMYLKFETLLDVWSSSVDSDFLKILINLNGTHKIYYILQLGICNALLFQKLTYELFFSFHLLVQSFLPIALMPFSELFIKYFDPAEFVDEFVFL